MHSTKEQVQQYKQRRAIRAGNEGAPAFNSTTSQFHKMGLSGSQNEMQHITLKNYNLQSTAKSILARFYPLCVSLAQNSH